jgi:hypothetical protein
MTDAEYIDKVNEARSANGMRPLTPGQAEKVVASMRKLQRTMRKHTADSRLSTNEPGGSPQ